MIFNVYAGLQVALVAIPAGVVYAIAHYGLGWDTAAWWAALVGTLCLVPVDGFARVASMGGSEDDEDESPAGIGALVAPSSGGHLMFLPVWCVGGALAVMLVLGIVNP